MPDFVMPSKFPFWSAIITQQAGSISVAGLTTAYVNIQPPSGETWLVDFSICVDNVNMWIIEYYDYDGTTRRRHARNKINVSYEYEKNLTVTRILTNTLYGSLSWTNGGTSAYTGYYGYSGFKLSKPLWNIIRNNNIDPQPWKRPTTLSLPPILSGLQDRAYEFLGINPDKPNDYALGILLEEDTPLAYDPATKFPVERLTVVVSADVLANIITKYKAGQLDLIQAGYGKYIDLFKKAGVI